MPRRMTSPRPPMETLTATVSLLGQDIPFTLQTRPLALGSDTTVQYYFMNSQGFRIARSQRNRNDAGHANFSHCLLHRWLALRSDGRETDTVELGHLVLAATFATVSRSNALQHLYRDAYLAPDATKPRDQSLPDSLRARIKAVMSSHDRQRIGAELDSVLGGTRAGDPDGDEWAFEQFEGILQLGVERFRKKGDAGLLEFVSRFDAWVTKWRKKGDQDRMRRLLDLFSYQCKASFFLCYANVWNDLIPWLGEHRNLDLGSERFLWLWHLQNQPLELPDGRVVPDVFRGQVLSLHPLSGFFMQDDALCAVAGRFVGSDASERVMTEGRAQDCQEYWDLVEAILTAAHLYRQALDRQEGCRGAHERTADDLDRSRARRQRPKRPPAQARSPKDLLEEFIATQGLECSLCQGALHVRGYEPTSAEADSALITLTCRACDADVPYEVDRMQLEQWLTSPHEISAAP